MLEMSLARLVVSCLKHLLHYFDFLLTSPVTALVSTDVRDLFSPFDMKRLDSYANNMLDYHVILDLLPTLAALYFAKRFPLDVKLSGVQSSILLALGLQRKSVEDIEVSHCRFLFLADRY